MCQATIKKLSNHFESCQVQKVASLLTEALSCLLPKKSPWLNPIEPKWIHGKRRVVEADGLLSAYDLADRVCAAFDCPHYAHLAITENVA